MFSWLCSAPSADELTSQAALRTALSGHPLHTVRILIFCHDIPAHRDVDGHSALPTCRVKEYMATVDLRDLARSFLDSIATVNLAVTCVLGHRTRDTDDARATRINSSVIVERNYLDSEDSQTSSRAKSADSP